MSAADPAQITMLRARCPKGDADSCQAEYVTVDGESCVTCPCGVLAAGAARVDAELPPCPSAEAAMEEIPGEAYQDDARPNGKGRPAQDTQPVRSLSGIDFGDMRAHLADGYIVKGLITPNSFVGIIGPTGSGKTFSATDLALHVAGGRPWRGRNVRKGLVVYGALEGPVSAENRFVAARESAGFAGTIPLRLTPGPINLRAAGDVAMLVEFVREAEAHYGEKCSMVFVDTLSRALAGGDENGPEDMGALVAGADAVRLSTGATVVLVHHMGKDETRGARGHSSLKAALDTEIEVSVRDKVHVATVTKQRDLPSGEQFPFTLQVVELGVDQDGDPVTSCVVEHLADVPRARKQPTGKLQTALLGALLEWQREHAARAAITITEFRALAAAQGIDRRRIQSVTDSLVTFGWLETADGGFRVLSEEASS